MQCIRKLTVKGITYFSMHRFLMVRSAQWSFATGKMNTEVFSNLTWKQLATPQLTKALIIKPIHMHSRVSQRSLFHGKRVRTKIVSCFSEKKHRVFTKVNKVKRFFYSDVLRRNVFATMSMHAFKAMKKMGSFDNYILCTKPKRLDSKFGEYLRELMLRKINDPDFVVPYIIGTNRKLKVRHPQKYQMMKDRTRYQIPIEFKKQFRTLQRKFGTRPEELNEEDYQKYVELEGLKKKLGKELDPQHPLLLELRQKMQYGETEEDLQKLKAMAKQAEDEFVSTGPYQSLKKNMVETSKKEIAAMNNKLKELAFDETFSDSP